MDPDFKPAPRPARSLRNKDSETDTKTQNLDNFRTPDEVAAVDDISPADIADTKDIKPVIGTGKASWRDKFKFSWPPGKREWVASLIIIVFCGSLTAFVLTRAEPKPVVSAHPKVKQTKPKATAKAIVSNLTGLPVDAAVNARPVTGVMIENSLDARPQSGLTDAGVVFEAIAEGGITRFLALYQDSAPTNVGPIRSARPYYVQWAMGFDAGYAHVGGSPEALSSIRSWGTKDLDQFHNGGSYHRSASRAAPHNVYTGIDTLIQLQNSKGYTGSQYIGFPRKKPTPVATPNAKSININISGPTYNTHYDYNAAAGTYSRSEGGAAHIDANNNKQISPNVVIAIVVPYSLQSDGYHSEYKSIGSGQAFIFQDGTVATGTWTKSDIKNQITFTDAAGKPIALNPGQTWITAVSAANSVSYSP